MKTRAYWVASFAFSLGGVVASSSAEPDPGAIRVINLGTQMIEAFSIVGLQFHGEVGLERYPGDPLTPAFGTDAVSYEMYWRLQDGTVHGDTVDLSRELPASADNDSVVISIHDDHLAVTWSHRHPLWSEYSRAGDPRIVPRPNVPYYSGCSGPLLEHPIGKKAWSEAAYRVQVNLTDPEQIERRLARGKCALDWYIPISDRQREQVDADTVKHLRNEWHADIDRYKDRYPENSRSM